MIIESKDITEYARSLDDVVIPDGWTVRMHIEPDHDSGIEGYDAEAYNEDELAAWRSEEWWFVGTVVTISDKDGFELGSASIWGTECGWFPGVGYTSPLKDEEFHYTSDLVWEAAEEAQKRLNKLQGVVVRPQPHKRVWRLRWPLYRITIPLANSSAV
jgi:hypothetical protein